MKSFKNKTIAHFVLFSFLLAQTLFAQQTSSVSKLGPDAGLASHQNELLDKNALSIRPEFNPYEISVPQELGTVEEVFQGKADGPLLVYIQDVHANYQTQINIKNILKQLVEKNKFSLIQLEGGIAKLDPTYLEPSSVKEANLKMIDFLLREGRITGADAFAVETEKPVQLYGIEEKNLYMENLKTFRKVYAHQNEVSAYFVQIDRLINSIGRTLFKPELLDFTRKTKEFSQTKIDLLDYLTYLNNFSQKNKLISLSDLVQMKDYPNLVRIIKLGELEKKIDQAKIKSEGAALKAEFLKNAPNSSDAQELLSRIETNEKGIRPRQYFIKLTDLANQAKINFVAYPELRLYSQYLIYQDEIDHRQVFNELKAFEKYLHDKLFVKPDEQAMLALIDFVNLLDQFFKLSMSRENIALYLKNKDKITPSWIAAQFEKLSKVYQVEAPAFGDVKKLDSYMNELEHYYRLALKRDQVFMENILSNMKTESQNRSIIITGGFHKDGLADHLRKQKISYVVINPHVDVSEGSENYVKVMLDQEGVVGSVFAGTFALGTHSTTDNFQSPHNTVYFFQVGMPTILWGESIQPGVISKNVENFGAKRGFEAIVEHVSTGNRFQRDDGTVTLNFAGEKVSSGFESMADTQTGSVETRFLKPGEISKTADAAENHFFAQFSPVGNEALQELSTVTFSTTAPQQEVSSYTLNLQTDFPLNMYTPLKAVDSSIAQVAASVSPADISEITEKLGFSPTSKSVEDELRAAFKSSEGVSREGFIGRASKSLRALLEGYKEANARVLSYVGSKDVVTARAELRTIINTVKANSSVYVAYYSEVPKEALQESVPEIVTVGNRVEIIEVSAGTANSILNKDVQTGRLVNRALGVLKQPRIVIQQGLRVVAPESFTVASGVVTLFIPAVKGNIEAQAVGEFAPRVALMLPSRGEELLRTLNEDGQVVIPGRNDSFTLNLSVIITLKAELDRLIQTAA